MPSCTTARNMRVTSEPTSTKSTGADPRSAHGRDRTVYLFGSPEMLSALESRLDSFGSATIHSAITIPAVIRVMRTHPGTSPRSSRSRLNRCRSATHICASTAFIVFPSWPSGHRQREVVEAREQREDHRHRENEEDDRHEHRDL